MATFLVVKAERSARRNKLSNIAIQGDASGTGIFTIASPNSNTDRTLVLPDEAGTMLTTAGVPASAMPAGSVIQVVQGRNDSITTTVNGAGLSIDAVSVSITPTSSTSKILLISEVYAGGASGQPGATSVFFLRNGSGIGQSSKTGTGIAAIGSMIQSRGYSNGDNMGAAQISYLDSPATTSTITYTTRMTTRTDATVGLRLNFCWNYSSNTQGFHSPCVSTITALEIAA